MRTTTRTLVRRIDRSGHPGAMVAAWLVAEVGPLARLHVAALSEELIVLTCDPPQAQDAVDARIAAALAERRFAGWSLRS